MNTSLLSGLHGLAAGLPYMAAVAYLSCVWLILSALKRVPSWVHALALVGGLAFRLAVAGSSFAHVLWPLVVVAVIFLTLVAVAARTVSGVSLFSVCVAMALTPIDGWPGLVLGLVLAAVVAGTRTWRSMGRERVWFLASDTLSGLGITMAGGFKPPQPEHIPTRDMLMDGGDRPTQKVMYLPPYLFVGVIAATLMAVVQAG